MREYSENMKACALCPRACGADRTSGRGICSMGEDVFIARAMLHLWEEPPISVGKGSGAIFFSGCPLRCVYCQNREISHGGIGEAVGIPRLSEIMLELQEQGAANINLVSPTQFLPQIKEAIDLVRDRLSIPIVWNTGGYERVEAIRSLEGYVDVYLTDMKYFSPELSGAYSHASDYFGQAIVALEEMVRQCGPVRFDGNGRMTKGVILRHLVLPGCRADSIKILEEVAKRIPIGHIRLSLMAQYTPDYAPETIPALCRRITSFEYESVLDVADALGYDGYMQERSSAKNVFRPDFNGDGVRK